MSGAVSVDRHLDWPGCFNVRDLGGLPAAGGRETRRGAVVRADSLERLSGDGWAGLVDHGVRTVIDLRNDAERGQDRAPRPALLETIELPLNPDRYSQLPPVSERGLEFRTPLYYRAHLQRFPELSAAVLRAIARAAPGGVVFHCVAGRDRSGLTAMLVLSLAGVEAAQIATDYGLSRDRLGPAFAAVGREDEGPAIDSFLAERGTTAAELITTTLASLDVEAQLRGGGLTDEDLTALRERLLVSGAPQKPTEKKLMW
jgi:protein-tyrosine phosphatase